MKKTNIYFWLFILSPALGYLILQSLILKLMWNLLPALGYLDCLSMGFCILLPIVAGGYYLSERGKRGRKEAAQGKTGEMLFLIILSGCGLALLNGFFIRDGIRWEMMSALSVFVSVVVVPLNEEIIYRGMVIRRAKEALRPMTAVIISAVMFGISRGSTGRILMAVFAGFVFGLIAERFGTIWASIPLHMAVNALVLWDRLYNLPILIYVTGGIMALVAAVIMSSDFRQKL